jgi:uncharacterized membrane protein (DUF485 family)
MARNARLGLILFTVYLALYGGFVFLSAFSPDLMEKTPIEGVNLAILYGFGLIVAALLMSLLYGYLCSTEEEASNSSTTADSSASDGGDE